MLWFLLTALAYASALAGVVGAVGFVAVQRYALLQRLLAAGVDRVLVRLVDPEGGHSVTHTDAGVLVTDLHVRASVLQQTEYSGSRATAASVARLELEFPSLSRPLTLRVAGVSLAVQQVRLPKPQPAEERAAAEAARAASDKAARLAVVEELLWGSPLVRQAAAAQQPSRWNPAGGLLGRLQAKAVQRLLGVAVQLVRVEIADVTLRYVQYGEPGPRPSASYLQGADGACLRVRSLTLLPQGSAAAAPSSQDGTDAADAAPATSEAAAPSVSSAIGALGEAASGAAGTAGAAPPDAAAEAAQRPWWQSLLQIPALLWDNVVTDRPSSSCLAVSGVSLSLLTYPSTWAGFHAAQAAAAAAAPRPPFSFTPGAFSAAGAAERASPHKRRRPRVTFQTPPTAQQQEQPEQQRQQRPPTQLPPQQGGSAAGAALAQDVQQHQARGGWQLDYFALLQAVPAEEHVLFQQWEFAVTLCLLPPGHASPAAAPPGGGSRAGSPARALHRRSSSSQPSASSTPRFGRRPTAAAAGAPEAAGRAAGLAAFQSMPAQAQAQPPPPMQRRQQSAASAGVLSDDGSLPPPHLHEQASLGADGHFDTDHEDESLHLPPLASAAANGPAAAAPNGAAQRSQQMLVPPHLDRSSMQPELPTVVTPAERQALGRLAWAVGHVADGGVLPTEAELQRRQQRQQAAEAAAEAQRAQAAAGPAGAADAASGPGPPQPPSDEAADGGNGSARMVLLDVSVSLKALIPELNAASLAILSRIADRQLHYSHYGAHWAARPQVAVHGHAAAWWQHAGEALAAECGRMMRREVPLSALPLRHRRRQEYQALYAASHTASPGFQEPGRRWWQRRRVQPAAADDLQRLQQLEASLTAEEIAHFRLAVAVKHNARLSRCRPLEQFVMDKVDAVVYNRVPPPTGLAQQLLHHDQPWLAAAAAATAAASAAAAGGAAGQGTAARAAAAAETFAYGLRLSASCPKLGVALCMRPPAAAPPEAQLELGPGQQRPAYVQVTLHSISAEMDPAGTLGLEVDRLVCGPCQAPLLPVPRRRKMLSSPSSVCRRVCKAADFFQYAVHGTVAEEAQSAEALAASPFLAVRISPRLGAGGMTVDCPQEQQAAWAPCSWRPGGSDISVQLAAVALVYHTPAFAALLEFLDGWTACRVAPWSWRTPAPPAGADCPAAAGAAAAAAGGAGAGSAAAVGPPPLPASPESVPQMALQSFSAHGVPTLGMLSLEGGTLEVHCPGIAVQLPYEHNAQFDIVRMGGQAQAAAAGGGAAGGGRPPADPAAAANPAAAAAAAVREDSKPPLRYALTVTMQNLHLLAVGEDAGGFLQGRVARRMDASAYVDVFSYLSSESRHVVASRLVPARVTFDASRRTFTDEGQEVDSLEAALREMELASMAKVWAHPDDLATIIQGIRSQEQLTGARLSLGGRFRPPSTTISQSRLRVGPVGPVRLPPSLDGGTAAPSSAGTPGQQWGGTSASGAGAGSMPGHGGAAARGPAAGGMPEEFLHDPSKYPVPLIPFLKCGSIRAHTLQPLSAAPDEPGGGELAMAVSSLGLQTWVSPLHIWHLLSVEKAVHSMFDYLERATCIPYPAPAEAAKPAAPAAPAAAASPSAALVRPVSPKLLLSFGVAQVSLLWLIGTWTPKGSTRPSGSTGGPTVSYRRAWGISVQRDDDAYLWARWLAPVYSVTVANIKTALRLQTNGSMTAGASVDGIIVRDLQLSQSARHAYVLRPLPARARRLNTWHAALRRTLLGIAPVSHGKKLWARACQTVFLRARTSAIKDSLLGDASPLDAVVYGAPFPLAGPQVRVKYASVPATRFRPAAAELQAELGQMLACVRIKQQASMNAFATQLTQITNALGRPSAGKEAAACAQAQVVEQPPSPTAHLPKLQTALKVTVTVVGIDMLFRVQSRQLMSLKLEQGRVTVDQRAVTRSSGPRDVRLHVAASVQDVVVQDLRARKEHSLVLIPHGGEDFCTLELAFTSFVDPRRAGPRLNILVQNPRVLLMLRFVADVMDAVSIITSATSSTEEKAAAAAEGAAAAGAPATAAAVAGAVRASQTGATAAAVAEAVVGETAAGASHAAAATAEPVAAAAAKGGAARGAAAAAAAPVSLEPQLPPLEIMVQLSNVGIVLPTSSDSTSALGASIDHLLVAMPGAIMPEAVLADCELPQVVGMMQEAVQCTHEFKYTSFHETNAAARAAADAAVNLAAAERAEREAEKAEKAAERNKAKGSGPTGPSVAQRLKQGMERVGEAAAAEAMGASDIAALSSERRMRAALRAKEERQRPPGVLYLNERDAQTQPSGVLHIDASQLSFAGAPSAAHQAPRVDVPEGAAGVNLDKGVASIVENIGRGIKNLFDGDGGQPDVAVPLAQPAASAPLPGRRASVVGPRSPSVQVVPGDVAQTNLTPLLLDAADEFPAGEERPLADPSLLISIEAWTVRRGTMQLIPNFYRQLAPGKKAHAASPPTKDSGRAGQPPSAGQAGSASEQAGQEGGGLEHKWSLPPSLTSFSWPVEVYDLVEGALFWQPTSIALGLFTMPDGRVPLVHFSSTPLDLILNAPNYTALMDFVGGNLDEYLHPERHAAQLAEQPGASVPPAAEAAPPPPPPPSVPPQVQYNPSMKFGPEPGLVSKLRLTIATPRLSITFEAHPREWQDPTPAWLYAGPKDTPSLRPFMRAQASMVLFDLGVMPGGETFMKIVSTSIDLQDLRTAYRLQEFLHGVHQPGVAEEEEEEGMATPPSHFSDSDSERCGPVLAEAEADRRRSGLVSAAQAGSAEAADALAPPEVRQRVLSDAAADLLHDELTESQRAALLKGCSPSAAMAEAAAGGGVAEVEPEGAGLGGALGSGASGPAVPPQQRRLEHQGSEVTVGQPTPRPPGTRGSGADGGGLDEDEGTLGTPATPSTGGFSFMLPGSQQGQGQQPTYQTPGLPGLGLGGMPPITEGRRTSMAGHYAHTGNRQSVARRLSEQAERRRSIHTPSTGASGGPPSAAHPSPTPGAGSLGGGGYGGDGGGGQHSYHYSRVIELLPEDLIGQPGDDVAVIRVLSAPCGTPPHEATGSRAKAPPGSNPRLKLEVSLAMHSDSTMGVEVALSEALLNWPYFHDLSLIWSMSNIFTAPGSPQRPANERNNLAPPERAVPPLLPSGPSAWLYFNLLITQSQIYLPIYEVAAAQELCTELWGSAGGPRSEFERLADMALAVAAFKEADETGELLGLEQRGLALSATALRFAYAYGGDGESNYRVDLRDTAAFVRDRAARVNCAVLPFSCKVDVDMKAPQAAEVGEIERLHQAASAIQRAWRAHCTRKMLDQASAAALDSESLARSAALSMADFGRRSAPRRLDSMLAAVETVEGAAETINKPWQLIDDIVLHLADEQGDDTTRSVLLKYKQESQERSQLMYLQRFRATASTVLRVEAGQLTLRGAFSHIPFWQTASRAVERVVMAPAPHALPASAAASPTRVTPQQAQRAGGAAVADAKPKAAPPPPFRPTALQVSLAMQQGTLVLCNDKPETFGAPDVLQCTLAGVSLAFDQATPLPKRTNMAARLSLKSYASFLNSSTSRWEALYDPWPLQAEYVNVVSPIYESDRQENVWLTSEQHLDLNFNPASLLSIGDALAFLETVQKPSVTLPEELELGWSEDILPEVRRRELCLEQALHLLGVRLLTKVPSGLQSSGGSTAAAQAAEQAALASSRLSGVGEPASDGGVLSRAPQKYLIQNQSGMKVFYWADGGRDGARRSKVCHLENGRSETLQVLPASKRLSFAHFGSAATGSERLGATINLHFEGNWMPVLDVAVNVVGKYRYRMTSPADSTWVPLIIDIILVGRTKIITLHSGIWLENQIDMDINVRLHVPTTSLVPPPAGTTGRSGVGPSAGDVTIGPLAKHSGCYLPITAALGGLLFLRPAGYREASRDVVRLSPDINHLLSQQGYITCEPDGPGPEEGHLHVALQAAPAKLLSEFQAFKHMECLAPGAIQRASSPLEVTLSVQPTLVLQNALPYDMRVLLWQHLPPPPVGDAAGPLPAASGPVEPPGPRFSAGIGHATTTPGRGVPPPPSPLARESIGLPFLLDFVSPRGGAAQAAGRRRQMGRYVAYTLRKGCKQSLYVDMRQVVQLHASVEEIGMRSARWTTISHGVRYTQLPDGTMGLEAAPKLPQDVPMRMLGVGMELPTSQDDPSSIDRYLAKLKDAALHLRLLHAQFHSDTKAALSSADVEAAVGRVRALAKRFVKSSRDVVARGAGKGKAGRTSRRANRSRPGRERFPTMAETRGRRVGVVELSSAVPQPVAGASGRLGEPLGSTISSEFAEAAAEAADAALQPAAPMRLRQQSAGHIIVEAAPRPQVTARALPVPAPAADGQPAASAGAAELTDEERALQRQAAEQAQQAQQAAVEQPAPLRPPALSLGLGLSPLREESVEGSQAQSISVASTPKGGGGSTAGGLPAAAAGPSAAASPSQASDAQLLSEVPLSAGAPAAAAGGVAGGRVAKRRSAPNRFSRALNCFGLPARSSSGPPPAPSTGAGRVTAAPAAAPGSTAGGGSTNPSPSLDSRASSRVLLSDRVRRSDLLASTGAEAGEAAAVRPAAAAPGSGAAAHGTSSDQGEIAVLEAVPESSAAEQAAPAAEPSGLVATGAAVAATVGAAAVAVGDAAAEATARALAAAAAPPASGSQRWWKLLRTKEPQAEQPEGRVQAEAVVEGQQQQHQQQAEPAGADEQQAEEPPRKRRLRTVFQGWRMHCLDAVWRRKARAEQQQQQQQPDGDSARPEQPGGAAAPSGGAAAAEAPREAGEAEEEEAPGSSESDDEGFDHAQLRAPAVLHLGLHNSLSEVDASCGGSCTVTLFAPYWFNNRTGVDLFYQDRLSAPAQPLLLGHPLPWDYGEVFTPGTSMEMAGDQGSASNSRSDMGGLQEPQEESLVLDYKLVLMNKQEEVMVGLAHVPNRRYSSAIQIKTVGNKSSVELRGPVDAVPPEPMRASDMPAAFAKGLHRGVRAAAAGAIAGGKMGADMLMPSGQPESPGSEEMAPPPAPIIQSPSEGHISAEQSASAVAEESPGRQASGSVVSRSPGEHAPAGAAAATDEGRPARLTVPHSPFDAPAAPGGGAEPSPRELRRILSAPASQEVRLSQLHGPSPLGGSAGGSGHGTPSAASVASRARHLRRASMQEGALVETLASEPGTLLVRLTSTTRGGGDQMTPTGRQLRRLGSSIGSYTGAAEEEPQRADPELDSEAEEAVQQMQQVPIPGEASTSPPPRAAEAEVEARLAEAEEQQAATAAAAAAPADAGAAAAAAREGSVIRQVSHMTEAAANMQAHAEEQAALPLADRRRSSISGLGVSLHHRRSSRGGGEPSMATIPSGQSSLPSASFVTQAEAEAAAEQPPQTRAIVARADGRRIQRAYEFAVDVAAGPPDSMFRHTKLLTLKPKFMIHNETGMPILVKQFGTENPDTESPDPARFARKLLDKQRAAVYWDDAELARELVIKPLPHGDEHWCWSGSFPIRETEWYFGLRIRHCPPYHPDPHKRKPKPPMNIPVNVTVGPYGAIQVTLKSPKSVSPYRIHNACKDVVLHFVQLSLVNRPHSRRYVDCLEPNQAEPYAWDEPTQRSQLRVQAKIKGEKTEFRIADYALDQLGDQPTLMLPTHGGRAANAQRRLYKSLSSGLPDDLKQKLVSLLAADFSKKVYVTVYADGPTRVLRFSDDRNLRSQEARNQIRDLAARLKQVETQLRQVNAQFARLNDTSGAHVLDLYGRTAVVPRAEEPQEQAAVQRKASKRMQLSETTRALIRQAHSKLPRDMLGGSLPGSQAASQPGSPPVGGGARGTPSVSFRQPGAATGAAAGQSAAAQAAGSRPGTAQGPGGVLRIPEESDERAQRLLPYRRLVIRTGSEPGATPEPLAADSGAASGRSSSSLALPSREIQPAESGDGAESQARGGPGHTTLRVSSISSDVGHLTPTHHSGAAGGSSRRVASMSKTARRGASKLSGQSVLRHGQDLVQDLLRATSNTPDAVLLLGGDLTVQVLQAQGLAGQPKSTHAFARVYINEPFPSEGEDPRAKQTSVVWQTCSPVWDESLVFRDVCTASELVVEIWDLGGNRSTAQMDKLTHNPSEVIKSCRFLGCAEMALSDTWLSSLKIWLPLMRCDAGDIVSGQVQLDITWEASARSVLTTKLRALERVLAQRQEILAALRPVPAAVVRGWEVPEQGTLQAEAAERTLRGGMMAAGVSLFGVDNELGMSGAGWGVQSSKVAAEVLARHAHDHNRRHLVATVLEARGLAPRRGVVVALSASELPKPEVSLELKGYPAYTTPVLEHTLQPRWDASVRHAFMNVDPAEAALTVRLHDARGGFLRSNTRLLGEATIHCSHIKGESPTYVWVPLSKPRRRRGKNLADVVGDEPNELQVHLRLQWRTDMVRGKSTKVEVNLAGLSLVVMGGLQDELFNLTTDEIRTTAIRSQLDMHVEGSIQKVQLDNQMLDAVQPVVLAPAVEYKPSGAVTGTTKEPPLVAFRFTRSFAGEEGGEGAGGQDGSQAGSPSAGGAPASGQAQAGALSTAGGAAAAAVAAAVEKVQSIKSFKDIRLDIGAMDLMTDEAFLEAVLSFMTSIPTADIYQEKPWQQQQRRLLDARFGPREVESLAINAIVPAPEDGKDDEEGDEEDEEEGVPVPIRWVLQKETRSLEVLHGQSDLSSWYFIESAEIGPITLNVTVSLSSRLLSTATRNTAPKTTHTGTFNRALGASGFSLVNVANVPILLGRWVVGNDPAFNTAQGSRGLVSNGFLSQKALVNNLYRHYTREGLKEAHKVLGGAGPAVASVPLTVLWAGGSAFALVTSITKGHTGPVVAVQQLFYVPLMTMSMLVSGFSRMLAATLAAFPPYRLNGDEATVQRIIRRPNSALEAGARAPVELVYGFTSAAAGVLLDPITGWQQDRWLGLTVGLLKGSAGLLCRPFVGALEGTSKLFYSLALTSLGREGILGRMQRRVKAPGTFTEEAAEQMEEGPRREAQLQLRALMAAWQRVLPEFFPQMAEDTVEDVVNIRSTRVVLITDHHIAYLRARHMQSHSIYKAKWLVPISELQNLSGDSETLKISITHVHRYDLWLMGVWPVAKRKGMRCGSRPIYERMVVKLSRLLQKGRGEGGDEEPAQDPGLRRFAGADLTSLTILSQPYVPPPPAPAQGRQPLALPAPSLPPTPHDAAH